MSISNPTHIKEQVRERYAGIAVQSGSCCAPADTQSSSCCSPSDPTSDIQLVDYSDIQDQVVEGSDLGLGCGTPTLAAAIQPGETVLDLGSGAGIDVFLAAKAVGPEGQVIGVDMTPEMLARARANAEQGGFYNVEFRLGELEALPVDDNSIDVVLSNCVINLVPDKTQVFREIYRVLNTRGRFSISDIVTFGEVPEAIKGDIALWTGCIAGAMDRDEYLALVGAQGFSEVAVEKQSIYDASMMPASAAADSAKADTQVGDYGFASITVVGIKPR